MIGTFVVLAIAAYILKGLLSSYLAFRKHVDEAKKSGLPYVYSPVYLFSRTWMTFSRLIMPILLKVFPKSWLGMFAIIGYQDWIWPAIRKPFEILGSDTFLVVGPGRTIMYTSDAEVVQQITSRKTDFPKPLELYKALDIYGSNLVSSEGMTWRHHRKLTAPSFNERNNRMVWDETLHQGEALIKHWNPENGTTTKDVHTLPADCMKLALHVISRAGFGIPLLWPHEEEEAKARGEIGLSSSAIPAGHTMSFGDALATVLQHLIPLIVFPEWMLRILPFKMTQTAYKAFKEWGKYMADMVAEKKDDLKKGKQGEGFDLAGAFVRGAGIDEDAIKAGKLVTGERKLFSDEELMGNMFVMLLAGHETTANTLHFSLLYLALNQQSQRNFQRDLDQILGSKSPKQWTYDEDMPRLFGGMTGAVMNETLRLIPPATGVPKSTPPGQPQALTVDGKRCIVPENTNISLDVVGLHRNPKYWPSTTPGADSMSLDNDLNSFRPERWILEEAVQLKHEGIDGENSDDTSSSLFKPARCAFMPFSDGARSCIGKRFAQVETMAALSVLLKEYSVELAVDDFATDAEVEAMSPTQRKEVWQKAADRLNRYWRENMITTITIQLHSVEVPIRLVKRGHERFRF